MTHTLSIDGILPQISDIVAEASMQLPSLVNWYDGDFLRQETCKTVATFLRECMAEATVDDRRAFQSAQEQMHPLVSAEILERITQGPDAAEHLNAALTRTRETISKEIVSDYGIFVRSVASQN